jgi:hypothetical protein
MILVASINDHLWFAFFHEIAHILKHKKQLFLEEKKEFSNDKISEDEADKFAANSFSIFCLISYLTFKELKQPHGIIFLCCNLQELA